MTVIEPVDFEERALFHLELLGCYVPEDAQIEPPWARPIAVDESCDDDDYDDDLSCTRCGGEGFAEVDDLFWDECDESGWGPCNACRGTGLRRHQWIF